MIVLVVVIAVVAVVGISLGPIMSQVETPNYQVVANYEQIEFRRYPELLTADVTVVGPRQDAVSDGFRILADYIFGNNDQQLNISMTAPVMQQPVASDLKGEIDTGAQTQWQVSFVMPSDFEASSLPTPQDTRVVIDQKPASLFAAIEFSGKATAESIADHQQKLLRFLELRNIQALSEPVYAFYNPPWTIPAMRRNEVMIEIECPKIAEIDC